LGEAMQALASKVVAANRSAADGRAMDYGAMEREIGHHAAAIEREAHFALLQALDVDADRVRIEGHEYVKVGRDPGRYQTKAGTVSPMRSMYRQVGVRDGKTVDPISLRAGVI